MASKLLRKLQKRFGDNAPVGDVGEFGSFAAGLPATSKDPDAIQSQAEFLDAWKGAIVGGNSPAIEDRNGLDYLWAYQLGYLMQTGVPEWITTQEYFIGGFASDGLGNIYRSITDNNIGNALTDLANWKLVTGNDTAPVIVTQPGPQSILDTDGLTDVIGLDANFTASGKRPIAVRLRSKVIGNQITSSVGGSGVTNSWTVRLIRDTVNIVSIDNNVRQITPAPTSFSFTKSASEFTWVDEFPQGNPALYNYKIQVQANAANMTVTLNDIDMMVYEL